MNLFDRILRFIKARYAPRGARQYYSQTGEDIVAVEIFKKLRVQEVFYIDIGAHHPVFGNNTYLFYKKGSRGILVEPNEKLALEIKRKRPKDICLNVGVGKEDTETDFFAFPQSTRSTFSKTQAEEWERTSGQKPLIKKLSVLSLNTILSTHSPNQVPDLVSIDAEGLDKEILDGFNWEKKPLVFCIESAEGIDELMKNRGYECQARILHNAIYVLKRT